MFKRKAFIGLVFFFIFLFGTFCTYVNFYTHKTPSVNLYNAKDYPNKEGIKSLVSNLKKILQHNAYGKSVDIYVANFSSSEIPDPKNKSHVNVLLLGSMSAIDVQHIAQYDFIFASTKELQAYLKIIGTDSYYLPIFVDGVTKKNSACAKQYSDSCIFAVIGKQPEVVTALKARNYRFQVYETDEELEKLYKKLPYVSGIIANRSVKKGGMDAHVLFLKAIQAGIPILYKNNFYQEETKESSDVTLAFLFMDTLSYYNYASDIEKFFDCRSCREEKIAQANFLLSSFYISLNAAQRISYVLMHQEDMQNQLKDTINVFSPTYAGLYNNGDYWISKELEKGFSKFFSHQLIVFPLFPFADAGEILLYIRGGIPLEENKIRPDNVSIFYLLFPFFADEKKDLSLEEFFTYMHPELLNVDVVAVASNKMAEYLRQKGVDAYYVPQFTNTDKFYPDYQEKLKTDVLFVGNNADYRIAAKTVLEAGIPVTIYGNNWNGLAKEEYIDNNILRQYYSSAKIVLNDSRDVMRKYGFIINRIFDVTACKTLIISDYVPEIEEIYGDSVPMWKTKDELIKLVKYYLDPSHEEERLQKAQQAYEITRKNFTLTQTIEKFNHIIQKIKRKKCLDHLCDKL